MNKMHVMEDHLGMSAVTFSSKFLVSYAKLKSIALMMVVFFLIAPLNSSFLVTILTFLCLYRIFLMCSCIYSSFIAAKVRADTPNSVSPASSYAFTHKESV